LITKIAEGGIPTVTYISDKKQTNWKVGTGSGKNHSGSTTLLLMEPTIPQNSEATAIYIFLRVNGH
jgi:hypothetical protein